MGARFRSWWKKLKTLKIISILIVLIIMIIALVIVGGYLFNWDWTGFNSQENKTITITTPQGIYRATEVQSEKNLWDWLQLLGVLAIPVVVSLGAAWYTAQQGKVSDRENTDNQREAALQGYIDKMSQLILKKYLCDLDSDDEVRMIGRVRTLTVLPRLDPNRKRSVLQFLYESGLISSAEHNTKRIIDLDGADLSGANLARGQTELDLICMKPI